MSDVTRAILRQRFAGHIGVYETGTATGGSTTTLADTDRIEPDAYWTNFYLEVVTTTDSAAPEGEIRLITGHDQATGTLSVSPAFSAAAGALDTYALWSVRPTQADWAIDAGVRAAARGWYEEKTDTTTLDTVAGQTEYALPTDVVDLAEVWIQLDADNRMKAPPWHVEGTLGAQDLVFVHLPPATNDIGLRYSVAPTLDSAATDVLNVGAAGVTVQQEQDCADFITAFGLARWFGRLYNMHGQERDWNTARHWNEVWQGIAIERPMMPILPPPVEGPTELKTEERLSRLEAVLLRAADQQETEREQRYVRRGA
jgi:hypothetical protein